MTQFTVLDWHLNGHVPDAYQHLGRIPLLFDPSGGEAWLQISDNYPAGFNPEPGDRGWMLTADDYLAYPGLPAAQPSAFAMLGQERLLVYPAGWLVIVQPKGDFTVVRIEP